jgi:hypothetical protein
VAALAALELAQQAQSAGTIGDASAESGSTSPASRIHVEVAHPRIFATPNVALDKKEEVVAQDRPVSDHPRPLPTAPVLDA